MRKPCRLCSGRGYLVEELYVYEEADVVAVVHPVAKKLMVMCEHCQGWGRVEEFSK